MKISGLTLLLFTPLLLTSSCSMKNPGESTGFITADKNATPETKALFGNLMKYQDQSLMFGHQDDLAYGVGWWADDFRSDVHDVTGQYPAVFGWDAGEIGQERNIDSVSFKKMQDWMIRVYEEGGINTLSCHLDNPVTGGTAWDKTRAVYAILPGGEKHDFYKSVLNDLATFIRGIKTSEGTPVPIIFRPFHELNGGWFWWGRGNCTPGEFTALFRFTVEYLRDEKGLHNLLYCYSTDRFKDEADYMERFPGEEYVDLLGYDDYHSFSTKESIPEGIKSLRTLVLLGERMNKPTALTETGLQAIPIQNWWTDYVLKPIKSDSIARKITYMLVWRNADTSHHYAPYPGHPSAPGFREFGKDEFTWFLDDLPEMYGK